MNALAEMELVLIDREIDRRKEAGTFQEPKTPFQEFGEKYYDDPAGFFRDCIIWPEENSQQGATDYQLEIVSSLITESRVSARGIHGLGKTRIAAGVIHWFALTRDALGLDWKALTTATAWAQLVLFLWPEIHLVARNLNWDIIARPQPYRIGKELLNQRLNLKHGYAAALTSSDHHRMEGGHAKEVLVIFDEAKAIPDPMWDAMEGVFSQAGVGMDRRAFVLAISTPGDPVGRFYQIHSQQRGYTDWWVRHVTKEEAVAAGRVAQEWIDQRREQWGEESAEFQNRVEGQFSEGSVHGLMTLRWITRSNELHAEWEARGRTRDHGSASVMTHIGIDVGGGLAGNDSSTIAFIYDGHIVGDLEVIKHAEDPNIATMELAAYVLAQWRKNPQATVSVDGIGIGAGILHWLRTQGCPAIAFMAGNRTELMDEAGIFGFTNWRSAAWFGLADFLSGKGDIGLWIPQNEELQMELLAMRSAGVNLRNQKSVIAKEDVRSDIGRSTDLSDSILHGVFGPILLNAEQAAAPRSNMRQSQYRIGDY